MALKVKLDAEAQCIYILAMALDSDKFDARFALESYLHGASPEYLAQRHKVSAKAVRRWLEQRGYAGKRLEHPPVVMPQSGLFSREILLHADEHTAEQVRKESDHILEAIVQATELLKQDLSAMKQSHPIRTAHMPYVPHAVSPVKIEEAEEEVGPPRKEVKLPPPPVVRATPPPRKQEQWSPEQRHPQLTDSAPAFKLALQRIAEEKRAADAKKAAEASPAPTLPEPPRVKYVMPKVLVKKSPAKTRTSRVDKILFRSMCDEGYTALELAEEFGIGKSTSYKLVAEYKAWLAEIEEEDGEA